MKNGDWLHAKPTIHLNERDREVPVPVFQQAGREDHIVCVLKNGDWLHAKPTIHVNERDREVPVPVFQQAGREDHVVCEAGMESRFVTLVG